MAGFLGRRSYGGQASGYSPRRGGKGRLLIALAIAAFSVISYCRTRDYNEVTDEVQYVDLSPEQEVAIGLQAAPEMEQQYGGLYPDPEVRAFVDRVGRRLVERTAAKDTPYRFDFHLLNDPDTLNAFALPGGQVFVTAGLMNALDTEGELAGVLGHEIGHVVARHGAEHMAKQKLTQGLTGADLGGTTLAGAVLREATYDKQTAWPKTGVFKRFDPKARGANRV